MTLGRRAVLGGMTAALALPLVRVGQFGQIGLPAFTGGRAGIATVWGLAFWSPDAGEPPRAFARPAAGMLTPPAWHPEFS